uniref:UPAR/Ly6 domain-containing protein n=1 Tax=Clastoptera arizonana TaxID=38151 RepID=A0A1B6DF44_9HEMI
MLWPFFRCIFLAGFVQYSNSETENQLEDSEGGVTCYTCVNVSDNNVCNRYAIDRPCPQGENFCHTLHIMDSTGTSVVVNKKCADSKECWPQGVGCVLIDRQTVCVSCCDEMYCNITVPTNKSTATYTSKRSNRQRPRNPAATTHAHNSSLTPVHSAFVIVVLIAMSELFR